MACVLVVDDDDDIRDLIALWLRRAGHEVVAAANPFSALVFDQPRIPFDLMVLDVDMPGMDGFALLWLLRWEHQETPVIFVTARAWAEDVAAAAGVACLPKPLTSQQLLDAVDAAIGATADAETQSAQPSA